MNKKELIQSFKYVMNSIFMDMDKLKRIVYYWMFNGRIIDHEYKIIKNRYMGKRESIILTDPASEYGHIFNEILNLQYSIVVDVLGINLFYKNGGNNRQLSNNRGFFHIPFNLIDGDVMKIIDMWLLNDVFLKTKINETNSTFCEFMDLKIAPKEKLVPVLYRVNIMGVFIDAMILQSKRDSHTFSKMVYNAEHVNHGVHLDKSIIEFKYKFAIMYWIFSVIWNQCITKFQQRIDIEDSDILRSHMVGIDSLFKNLMRYCKHNYIMR